MESQIISNKTIADPEITYEDDKTSNKSTNLPQLFVQVQIFFMNFPDCLTARTVAVLGVALRSKNFVNKGRIPRKWIRFSLRNCFYVQLNKYLIFLVVHFRCMYVVKIVEKLFNTELVQLFVYYNYV